MFELSQTYSYVHINKTEKYMPLKVVRASLSLNLKDLLEEGCDSITKQALAGWSPAWYCWEPGPAPDEGKAWLEYVPR